MELAKIGQGIKPYTLHQGFKGVRMANLIYTHIETPLHPTSAGYAPIRICFISQLFMIIFRWLYIFDLLSLYFSIFYLLTVLNCFVARTTNRKRKRERERENRKNRKNTSLSATVKTLYTARMQWYGTMELNGNE